MNEVIKPCDIPAGAWRLHLQAEWPMVFADLASVIRELIRRDPLWYALDQRTNDSRWEPIIHRTRSYGPFNFLGEDHS